jgi:hypothetical protein
LQFGSKSGSEFGKFFGGRRRGRTADGAERADGGRRNEQKEAKVAKGIGEERSGVRGQELREERLGAGAASIRSQKWSAGSMEWGIAFSALSVGRRADRKMRDRKMQAARQEIWLRINTDFHSAAKGRNQRGKNHEGHKEGTDGSHGSTRMKHGQKTQPDEIM